MKRALANLSLILVIVTVSISAFAVEHSARPVEQKYKTPEYNGCIRQFYDPDMYHWLSFENSCGEALHIVYIPRNPGHGGSSMHLRAGRKDSTGYSRSEVSEKNGYELYVCPEGYNPVDANDRYVDRADVQRFRCKEE